MKLKEKLIRKINAYVQNSSMSEETKLFTENTVLMMDVAKKLGEMVSDRDAGYAQIKQLNDKLRHILEEL